MNEILWQPGETLEAVERRVIEKALRFYQGNKTQCARALNISEKTIHNKLSRYEEIDKERENVIKAREEQARRDLDRARGITGLPRPAEVSKAEGASDAEASEGLRTQPAAEAPAQHSVPVQQRQEVQGVSPQPSKSVHPKATGRGIPRGTDERKAN